MKLADLEQLDALRKTLEGVSYRQAAAQRLAAQRYADALVFWGAELAAFARPALEAEDCSGCGGKGVLWYVGKDQDPMDGPRQHKCDACGGTGKRVHDLKAGERA